MNLISDKALADVTGEIFMTSVLQSYGKPAVCQENSSLYDRIGQDTYRWLPSSTSSGVHSSLVYINYHLIDVIGEIFMTPILQSYMENQLSVKKILLYMTGYLQVASIQYFECHSLIVTDCHLRQHAFHLNPYAGLKDVKT